MLIKVLLGANIPEDVVVIYRPPGYAYFLFSFSSLDLTGQPFPQNMKGLPGANF